MTGVWLLTVTLWVMTVWRASEEICSSEPTLLASASLKIRATSKDSLWKDTIWCVKLMSNLSHSLICVNPHLIWAEANVAKLQDGGEDGPDSGDLLSVESYDLKAVNQELEVLFVLLPLQLTGTTLDGQRENETAALIMAEKIQTSPENLQVFCVMYLV